MVKRHGFVGRQVQRRVEMTKIGEPKADTTSRTFHSVVRGSLCLDLTPRVDQGIPEHRDEANAFVKWSLEEPWATCFSGLPGLEEGGLQPRANASAVLKQTSLSHLEG